MTFNTPPATHRQPTSYQDLVIAEAPRSEAGGENLHHLEAAAHGQKTSAAPWRKRTGDEVLVPTEVTKRNMKK